MSLQPVTTQTFDAQILGAAQPVLVEFSAPWCGYCRRLAPVLEQMDGKPGMPPIFAADVDDSPALAQRYGVDTIPTLLLFQGGAPGQPLVAPGAAAQIKSWLAAQGVQA